MIEPGSVGDWALLTGALAAISALGVGMYRWVLADEVTSERVGGSQATRRTEPSNEAWNHGAPHPMEFRLPPSDRGNDEEREGAA